MISKYMKNRHLGGREPLAVFAMEGREICLPEHEGATGWTKDQVIVAALVADLPEDGGRLRICFFPGVTGHENYFFDEGFHRAAREAVPRGPEKGFFGPKINMWALCAGTPGRWNRLEVTVEDVQAAVAYFDTTLDQIRAAGGIVSTVSDSST